ncbi:MAG TPA: 1,4-dihydroxy-6-naphthoate synthase [Candidatus Baltobacteraceae bacterium]|nr:1,4-dihydroxy-6-naphthoate synthase [Candidatus Baltobacteraceae bacterium]
MANPLTLAYSPCPNDTFIFAAWTNGLIEGAPPVRAVLEDVENLNNSALKADYQLTKVSYGAIPMLMDDYRILRAGGALGRGCGPLLISRPGEGSKIEDFCDKIVAIPGEMTTAFMLLRLAMGIRPQTLMMRFDQIVDAVAAGVADAGLIIHESRFTYKQHGLEQVADLGEWWESETGLPIPLGAILARNDLDDELIASVSDSIHKSLQIARTDESKVIRYIRAHATEMSEDVMRRHIATYVTDFTDDVGEEGERAVRELFARAHAAHILPEAPEPVFV